jgi:hypothetical protein
VHLGDEGAVGDVECRTEAGIPVAGVAVRGPLGQETGPALATPPPPRSPPRTTSHPCRHAWARELTKSRGPSSSVVADRMDHPVRLVVCLTKVDLSSL